jgi:adenylate cyclase
MTEVHGDEEAADLAGEFADAVGELLKEYAAEEVKRIGDAVMIRCENAAESVALGVGIVAGIGMRYGSPAVRVGMNTGPATERRGDWFGAAVNLAARVAGEASGGEVLLTESTRNAAGPLDSIELLPRGRRKLKNVSDPVQIHAAISVATATAEALPVDPVCRMAVDRDHSAGSLRYRDQVYFFCSLKCAGVFSGDPAKYAGEPEDPPAR